MATILTKFEKARHLRSKKGKDSVLIDILGHLWPQFDCSGFQPCQIRNQATKQQLQIISDIALFKTDKISEQEEPCRCCSPQLHPLRQQVHGNRVSLGSDRPTNNSPPARGLQGYGCGSFWYILAVSSRFLSSGTPLSLLKIIGQQMVQRPGSLFNLWTLRRATYSRQP